MLTDDGKKNYIPAPNFNQFLLDSGRGLERTHLELAEYQITMLRDKWREDHQGLGLQNDEQEPFELYQEMRAAAVSQDTIHKKNNDRFRGEYNQICMTYKHRLAEIKRLESEIKKREDTFVKEEESLKKKKEKVEN